MIASTPATVTFKFYTRDGEISSQTANGTTSKSYKLIAPSLLITKPAAANDVIDDFFWSFFNQIVDVSRNALDDKVTLTFEVS